VDWTVLPDRVRVGNAPMQARAEQLRITTQAQRTIHGDRIPAVQQEFARRLRIMEEEARRR